jgi:hypothetical protein
MRARRANLISPLATVVLALLFSGCASYSDSFSVIESDMATQRFGAALDTLERQKHQKRDQVLYLLNKAMLERMNGDFAASNRTFERPTSMDALCGVSIREQALSFAINDATRSYTGETYERVLVHLYTALNYLQLGDLIDARVEALQVDERLREIAQKIPESRYTEDALARYLTGMIYEEMGERSDAMISYRQAYEAYRRYREKYGVTVPSYLKQDLLRLSQQLGLSQEMRQYQKEFQIEHWMSAEELAQKGELVFILQDGLAPIKREQAANVVDRLGPYRAHLLPYFETRFTPVSGAWWPRGTSARRRNWPRTSVPSPSRTWRPGYRRSRHVPWRARWSRRRWPRPRARARASRTRTMRARPWPPWRWKSPGW